MKALIVMGILVFIGLIITLVAIWRAPEGTEDKDGFHHKPR